MASLLQTRANLEINMEHINELSGDVAGKVMEKVSAYLTAQPPCKQNFFTAHSTASGRCEQGNGVLRTLVFTKSGDMLKALSNLRDKVNSQFHRYLREPLQGHQKSGVVPQLWMRVSCPRTVRLSL